MALLDIKDLRVEFPSRRGHVVAIQNLTLDLQPGEILGVVGESGAGKSTIGNAVIGLLEPPGERTAGEISLDGQRIDGFDADEMRVIRGRRIGMIFQDYALFPHLTVAENIAFGLEMSDARGPILLITDGYHAPRACATARALGVQARASCPQHKPRPRTYLREGAAWLKFLWWRGLRR